MADDKTVRGTNFTCFHAGPMEGWAQFHMDPPEVPRPARGKLFLRKFLGSAGLEMSLNVVPPGQGMPFVAPLSFLCVQYRANSVIEGGGADGQKVEGKPAWPN